MKLAEGHGSKSLFRASTRESLCRSLRRREEFKQTVLIDCQIDCDEKVWPMVAPGAAIDQVFDEV